MKKVCLNNRSGMINAVFVLLLLTVSLACTRESETITGKVVDESNVPLNGVSVTACYSGWGWSSGQLVWDKDYCSEPAVTNSDGLYVINFNGSGFIRLRARKKGWTQTQDFNAQDSRIILTENETYSARASAETSLREENFRQRLPDESDIDYYCRVVLSRTRQITLNYQGETLSIATSALLSDLDRTALFTVRGSALTANSVAREAKLRINGRAGKVHFSFTPDEVTCEPDIHLIWLTLPDMNLTPYEQLEILIPSIRAMFDMHIWGETAKP